MINQPLIRTEMAFTMDSNVWITHSRTQAQSKMLQQRFDFSLSFNFHRFKEINLIFHKLCLPLRIIDMESYCKTVADFKPNLVTGTTDKRFSSNNSPSLRSCRLSSDVFLIGTHREETEKRKRQREKIRRKQIQSGVSIIFYSSYVIWLWNVSDAICRSHRVR